MCTYPVAEALMSCSPQMGLITQKASRLLTLQWSLLHPQLHPQLLPTVTVTVGGNTTSLLHPQLHPHTTVLPHAMGIPATTGSNKATPALTSSPIPTIATVLNVHAAIITIAGVLSKSKWILLHPQLQAQHLTRARHHPRCRSTSPGFGCRHELGPTFSCRGA